MTSLDLADGLRLIQGSRTGDHFGHESHLRFAWSLLNETSNSPDEAERVASLTIRHVAETAGNPDKYHCTVTFFWIRHLAHIRDDHPGFSTLDEAIASHPELLDPHLVNKHWSDINTEEARHHWVEPDLAPLR